MKLKRQKKADDKVRERKKINRMWRKGMRKKR
jgi:hypothetical protein